MRFAVKAAMAGFLFITLLAMTAVNCYLYFGMRNLMISEALLFMASIFSITNETESRLQLKKGICIMFTLWFLAVFIFMLSII